MFEERLEVQTIGEKKGEGTADTGSTSLPFYMPELGCSSQDRVGRTNLLL